MMKSRKRIAMVSLCLGALFVFLHKDEDPPSSQRKPSSLSSTQKVKVENSASKKKSSESTEREVSAQPKKEKRKPRPVKLKSQKELTKQAYKRMVDYPDYSTPLNPNDSSDFIEARFQADVQESSSPEKPGLTLTSWSSKNYYTKKDTVILNTRLLDKGKTVRGKVVGRLESGQTLQFRQTRKGTYRAEVPAKKLRLGHHMVKIEAAFSGETLKSLNQFKVMKDYYSFNGVRGDRLDQEGNLIFDAEFDIKEGGAYLLEGTLYKEGEAIAIAEKALKLNSGTQTIPLKFHGYLFYKRRMSGPFELKNLQLSHIDENLESEGNARLIRPNFASQSLSWDQFNNQPYRNETIGRKLRKLESSR